ncbi:hypothetical protein OF83DRAFT_1056643 [Amylostereum chailletii]|nr:hypothetical protein OF83DRAFT_1056643 [Amylostereum chailletii]
MNWSRPLPPPLSNFGPSPPTTSSSEGLPHTTPTTAAATTTTLNSFQGGARTNTLRSPSPSFPIILDPEPATVAGPSSSRVSPIPVSEPPPNPYPSTPGSPLTPPPKSPTSKKPSPQPSARPEDPAAEYLHTYSCPICFGPPTNATVTPCGHILCGECLFTAVNAASMRIGVGGLAARCPVCRAALPGWDGRGGGVIGLRPRTLISL